MSATTNVQRKDRRRVGRLISALICPWQRISVPVAFFRETGVGSVDKLLMQLCGMIGKLEPVSVINEILLSPTLLVFLIMTDSGVMSSQFHASFGVGECELVCCIKFLFWSAICTSVYMNAPCLYNNCVLYIFYVNIHFEKV